MSSFVPGFPLQCLSNRDAQKVNRERVCMVVKIFRSIPTFYLLEPFISDRGGYPLPEIRDGGRYGHELWTSLR